MLNKLSDSLRSLTWQKIVSNLWKWHNKFISHTLLRVGSLHFVLPFFVKKITVRILILTTCFFIHRYGKDPYSLMIHETWEGL